MPEGKLFMLGVGAQKAGTTWLHAYLSALESTDFGFAKEYKVFDPVLRPELRRRRLRSIRDLAVAHLTRNTRSPRGLRARFILDRDSYYDYFAGLLHQDGIHLTGDISPGYSGLTADQLGEVRDNFGSRGIKIRPIFLMRDPVERCWSTVRMDRRNLIHYPHRARMASPRQSHLSEEEHLLEVFESRRFRLQTQYGEIVGHIEKAFGGESPIYGFYERLFTDETIRRFCSELGLSYRPPPFEKKVNVSEKRSEISEDAKAEVARFYAPAYRFAADRYGSDFIAEIWPNYRFVR